MKKSFHLKVIPFKYKEPLRAAEYLSLFQCFRLRYQKFKRGVAKDNVFKQIKNGNKQTVRKDNANA